MTVSLLEGHVVDVLAGLPAGHFHCAVTSPPYAWLRAYGTEPQVWQTADGDALCAPEQHEWHRAGASGMRLRNGQGSALPGMQTEATHAVSVLNPQMGAFCEHCHAWRGELGQEPTIELYVEHLVAVFRAVRRVLRADGCLWVNLAGCYYTPQPGGQNGTTGMVSAKAIEANRQAGTWRKPPHPWLKPLDWVDVPGLFAQAMQQDGWCWRSDVVWVKPSALPESVSGTRWERCRVLAQGQEKRGAQLGAVNGHQAGQLVGDPSKPLSHLEPAKWADCPGCPKCAANEGLVLRRGSGRPTKSTERILLFTRGPGYYFDQEAVREREAESTAERAHLGQSPITPKTQQMVDEGLIWDTHTLNNYGRSGRNLRDWWVISPEPFAGQHYAAFPSRLPERCILAGTSEWGCCPRCGAPWARVVERSDEPREVAWIGGRASTTETTWEARKARGATSGSPETGQRAVLGGGGPGHYLGGLENVTKGWRPTCACGKEQAPVPARVLDCFGGSGSTALAANRLGRDCTLVELKGQYVSLARKRLGREPLSLFAWRSDETPEEVGV